MSQPRKNPTTRLFQAIAAIVGLMIIVMLVLSYWGNYRSSTDSDSSAETTATIEATATPDGEGEQSAEGDEAEPATTVVVLIEGLNFRTAPSRDADLIRGLSKGDRLLYIATEDGWYKVKTEDDKEGYVSSSSQYTELEE